MPNTRNLLAAIVTFLLLTSTTLAQENGLPGNASSLREGHGDWQVACSVAEGKVRCAMSQIQVGENRRRALSIELVTNNDAHAASGALVLPFGLDLASGVSYRLDEGDAGAVQPFRTCLPVGCIVDIAFDADTVASLRTGNKLNVIATADGGQEFIFSISLAGFSSAYDRVIALAEVE
ncbi:invasion associated locus B family protein [Nitratireductor kimnyeongensis]|uniref:Invasion associated locus B family protein n=1 Tax=Nitratireductor kimnyeongensis TaxID=430679 RepID=A0ABW0T8S3_9HYPH|nr:invasion associated locus B family protein [Nitratireductor kimnyeongensis]QZZ34040.1 invasion associated locus B family protein [Nitratireductor kimnyeongensis]